MQKQALIAGGGIGGMAAALACLHAGWEVRLYERAPVFEEIGAGVQLGPNVVRRLNAWGLDQALQAVAAFPEQLQVRCGISGQELASLPLGQRTVQRYGAAYATIHRADLHQLLLQAVQQNADLHLSLGHTISRHADDGRAVLLQMQQSNNKTITVEGDALIAADGLHSIIRTRLLGESTASKAPHMAWRAVVPHNHVPKNINQQQVTLWLGPQLHVVHYPIQRGEAFNIVAICSHRVGQHAAQWQDWNHTDAAEVLTHCLAHTYPTLQDLIRMVPGVSGGWRVWPLLPRAPISNATEMARGLVALLGDAAHPMFPYLAQGAGMAIEDATELQHTLAIDAIDIPSRLQRYALNRWQRNAAVQKRAIRNGHIFHLRDPLRLARNTTLQLLGQQVLDVPWLYRG